MCVSQGALVQAIVGASECFGEGASGPEHIKRAEAQGSERARARGEAKTSTIERERISGDEDIDLGERRGENEVDGDTERKNWTHSHNCLILSSRKRAHVTAICDNLQDVR